jgi:hypothetical protein
MPALTTANRSYQLPDKDNYLDQDVYRLIAAITAIDTDVASLLTSVAARALLVHTHVIADVSGLQAALNNKLDVAVGITLDQLTDVNTASAASNQFLRYVTNTWVPVTFDASMISTGQIAQERLPAYLAQSEINAILDGGTY